MLLGELDQVRLDIVWVVLDLEGRGLDLGVCEEVEQKSARVVGNTNALGQTLCLDVFESPPCVLEASFAVDDLAVRIVREPTGWVADLGSNILERNGEVDQVQVKVVNTPVLELLLDNGLDLLVVVEGLPKLGDNEELLALYKTLLDGAGNTLARLDFVAVVWMKLSAITLQDSHDFVPKDDASIPNIMQGLRSHR